MNENSNFHNEAEQSIAQQLGNLVGEGEVEARRIMGDSQYDKMMSFMERSNELTVKQEEARVNYLENLTALQGAMAFSIVFSCVMGLAWSLYFWIK